MDVWTLGEDLLLLALDEKKGTLVSGALQGLPEALAGAVIMDLTLLERLTLHGRALVVSDPTPTGDDLLDEALSRIASARRPRSVSHWVGNLRLKQRRRLLERLVARGVLRRHKDRVLGVFPRTRFPAQDPTAGRQLRQQLRTAVLGGGQIDTRRAFLLSLAQACGLVGRLLSRDERRLAKQRINALVEGELLGKAVSDAVASAVTAGAAGAVTAAVVAGAVSTTGS
jgi:Golgi phosphoprotein 3 (GPP34)